MKDILRKTIYLHVGMWKCGSSSIQYFFDQHMDEVVRNECLYPAPVKSARVSDWQMPYLHEIGNRLISQDFGSAKSLLADAIEKLREGDFTKLVLSGENFLNAEVTEHLPALFKNYLDEFDFQIIVYVRPLFKHAVSAWQQEVKISDPHNNYYLSDSIEDYCSKVTEYDRLLSDLHLYEEIFGKEALMIRPFEKTQFYEGCLIKDFLKVCGLGGIKYDESVSYNMNDSTNRTILEKCRILNQLFKLFNVSWIDTYRIKSEFLEIENLKNHDSTKILKTIDRDLLVSFSARLNLIEGEVAKRYLSKDRLFVEQYDFSSHPVQKGEYLSEQEIEDTYLYARSLIQKTSWFSRGIKKAKIVMIKLSSCLIPDRKKRKLYRVRLREKLVSPEYEMKAKLD